MCESGGLGDSLFLWRLQGKHLIPSPSPKREGDNISRLFVIALCEGDFMDYYLSIHSTQITENKYFNVTARNEAV